MDRSELGPQTKVALTISSWFHVVTIIAAMAGIYFALRADVTMAISQSAENAREIRETQSTIIDMRLGISSIQADVTWFRKQYEEDQKRRGLR